MPRSGMPGVTAATPTGPRSLERIRVAFNRLWQLTAALATLLLCGLLVGAAQGSIQVIAHRPHVTSGGRDSWARWCLARHARADRTRLAFCARVNGRVVYSIRGPNPGEAHVAVVGGFHLTVVKLPRYAEVPSIGSRLVAIGPLLRARNGQREVQAFRVQRT
ncbi:MAG: hypothetical protein ACJ780_19795 [Solirubrobacteraceae bacterium]